MKAEGDFSIRRLTEKDAEEYRRLRIEALRKAPAAFCSGYAEEKTKPMSFFVNRLAAKNVWVFGAVAAGRLVGTAGLLREERRKLAHQAVLVGMYVAASHQKQGIGSALLDAALAHARKLGVIRYVKLSVMSGNEPAGSLYRSRGFEVYGVEPEALFVGGRYYDEEYLMLRLCRRAIEARSTAKSNLSKVKG